MPGFHASHFSDGRVVPRFTARLHTVCMECCMTLRLGYEGPGVWMLQFIAHIGIPGLNTEVYISRLCKQSCMTENEMGNDGDTHIT